MWKIKKEKKDDSVLEKWGTNKTKSSKLALSLKTIGHVSMWQDPLMRFNRILSTPDIGSQYRSSDSKISSIQQTFLNSAWLNFAVNVPNKEETRLNPLVSETHPSTESISESKLLMARGEKQSKYLETTKEEDTSES